MLYGLIYVIALKVIFVAKDVSGIVFEGGIFGGAQNIWGNLCLNSTSVLFDSEWLIQQHTN